jgi:hypothetical protein
MSTLPSEPESTLDKELQVAIIFSDIFHREALRAMLGNANQLKRARAQLRACLDRIDEILGEE